MKRNTLITAINLAMSTTALALSLPAITQENSSEVTSNDENFIEEVIVTGSRIPRTGFDTVQPTTIVDSEFMKIRGFTNVADALNEIPSFGIPGNSTQGTQAAFGVGQSFVNFYGLGSQRTLTLVNGRRFVSSNTPSLFGSAAAGAGVQVDLNVIPSSMIERIETVGVGGAPIYGADAIAGTVNVILKNDFEGLEINANHGFAEDENDFQDDTVSFLFGGNFDDGRGNIVIGFEHSSREGLIDSDRDHIKDGWQFREPSDPTSPFGRVLVRDVHANIVSNGGVITPGTDLRPNFGVGAVDTDANGNPVYLQFAPDGSLVPYDVGRPTGNAVWSVGGEGLFLPDVTNLFTPLERDLVNVYYHYDFSENFELYGEFFYANNTATELANQPAFQSSFFGEESSSLRFDATHPLLTPAAKTTLTNLGLTEFYLQRSSVDLRPTNNAVDSELTLWRAVNGLRGNFFVAGRTLNWDVSYNIGRSDMDSSQPDIVSERFFFALDVVTDANGNPACRVVADPLSRPTDPATDFGTNLPTDRFDDCVPLDIFGQGRPSQEALEYITATLTAKTSIEQEVFSANFNMELFDLPAGAFAIAGGYEHRREEAKFDPGGWASRGMGRASPIEGVVGKYNTDEFYLEFRAPLVTDSSIPGLYNASIEGAFREVDNSFAGKDNTYTIGGRYMPIQELEIRGNFTRSVRAPAITELFLPVSGTTSFANDPCDQRFINDRPNPSVRRANCIADGITDPDTFVSNVANASVQGFTGGNIDLVNEVADAWTAGLIFRPSWGWSEGITLWADYIEIELEEAIESFTLTQIMQSCYDQATFPNEFCNRFSRLPNGQLPSVNAFRSGFVNAGIKTVRGIEVQAKYNLDLATVLSGFNNPGILDISVAGWFPREDLTKIQQAIDDDLNEVGNSKEQGQISMRYSRDYWSLLLQSRYIGSAVLNNNDSSNARDIMSTPRQWLFNTAITYDLSEKIRLQLNVNNLTDEEPAPEVIAAGDEGTYDNIGRYIRFGVNFSL